MTTQNLNRITHAFQVYVYFAFQANVWCTVLIIHFERDMMRYASKYAKLSWKIKFKPKNLK